MFGRVASRLVTGPLAFLVAGTLDFLGYWMGAGRRAVRCSALSGWPQRRSSRSRGGSSTISPR